jgi:hypothetical protein
MRGLELRAGDCVPWAVIGLALTLTAVAGAAAPATPSGTVVSASAAPAELNIGVALTVTGTLTNGGHGLPGATLALQTEAYPFHGFTTVAQLTSGPGGRFSITALRPDRNTRLRVVAEGAPATASPEVPVFVDPAIAVNARRLGPGATRLSIRARHTLAIGSPPVSAWWYTAPRGTSLFRLAAVTPTRELTGGVTYASAIVNPPAKRFVYRVCLNPTWERAMGPPAAHGSCPQHDFKLRRDAG